MRTRVSGDLVSERFALHAGTPLENLGQSLTHSVLFAIDDSAHRPNAIIAAPAVPPRVDVSGGVEEAEAGRVESPSTPLPLAAWLAV